MSKPEVGGVISYLGTVRNFSQGGKVERIEFAACMSIIDEIKVIHSAWQREVYLSS